MSTNIKDLAKRYNVSEALVQKLKYSGKLSHLEKMKKEQENQNGINRFVQEIAKKKAINETNIKGMKKTTKIELIIETKETFYVPGLIDYVEDSVGGVTVVSSKFKQI